MKVFISQPMRDKTNEQIKEERERAIDVLEKLYDDVKIEFIDSFFENAPHDAKPVWYLGQSITLLSQADVAYFIKGWNEYRGCKIENTICREYGIPTIEE